LTGSSSFSLILIIQKHKPPYTCSILSSFCLPWSWTFYIYSPPFRVIYFTYFSSRVVNEGMEKDVQRRNDSRVRQVCISPSLEKK
jgi:hypothetical protein